MLRFRVLNVQDGQLPDGGSCAHHHARHLVYHGVSRNARSGGETEEKGVQPGQNNVSQQQERARPASAPQQQHALYDPLSHRERDKAHLQQLQSRERHTGR